MAPIEFKSVNEFIALERHVKTSAVPTDFDGIKAFRLKLAEHDGLGIAYDHSVLGAGANLARRIKQRCPVPIVAQEYKKPNCSNNSSEKYA